MTIDLYYTPGSSQCQAIQMVAAALNVDLKLIEIDFATGDHLKPEFLKINPQHTIPTLHDNGFALWETRPILVYLIEKYGPANSPLYPSDNVQLRATINQRLYFDMGTLYRAFADAYYPLFRTGTPPTEDDLKKVDAAFGFLNVLIGEHQFVAGDQLTVADFALFTTAALVEAVKFDFSSHKNVAGWYNRQRKTIPGESINAAGLKLAKERVAAAAGQKK